LFVALLPNFLGARFMSSVRFFLGASSNQEDGGIYEFALTGTTITKLSFTPLLKVGSLLFHPGKSIIYAGHQSNPTSRVTAFQRTSSGLEVINSTDSGGDYPVYLSVNPEATFLYVANYGLSNNSAFTEIPLSPDGSLQSPSKIIRHTGMGIIPDLQPFPHIHCASVTPNGKFVTVADLSLDMFESYPLDPSAGIDSAAVVKSPAPPGSGPRHILFEPDGTIAYVVSEIGNMVTSYTFQDGKFIQIKSVSTIPDYFNGLTKTAAIQFTPDRSALVVSNRGFDSIAVFAIDNKGALDLKNIVYSCGQGPRELGFIEGTNILVSGNKQTNNVAFFEYIPTDYSLAPVAGGLSLAVVGTLAFLSG
jgi:6-phosphogluconolactonase